MIDAHELLQRLQDKVHALDRNDAKQDALLEVLTDSIKTLTKAFAQQAENDRKRLERDIKLDQDIKFMMKQWAEFTEGRKHNKQVVTDSFLQKIPDTAKYLFWGSILVALYAGRHNWFS